MHSSNQNIKALGFWRLSSLVIGNMIGAGIFTLPASLAVFGSISIFSWILTAVGALLLAFMSADLAKIFPKTGGYYVYCRETFGDYIGFSIAYSYWISWGCANAAIAVALVGYLGVFFPILNEHAPGFNPLFSFAVKAGSIWLVTLINIIGVRSTGIWQLATTLLKIIPLLLVGIIGLFHIQPNYLTQNFNISNVSNMSALTGAAVLTLWAFAGLESAIIPVEDSRSTHAIAKATIFGTVVTSLIYIAGSIVIFGLIPATSLQQSPSPYTDAAAILFGEGAGWFVTVGAIISCFGALIGSIFVQVQVSMAAARDGLFPSSLAKFGKFNTPTIGYLVSASAITILLLLTLNQYLIKQFTLIVELSAFTFLIPYFVSAMAGLTLLAKKSQLLSFQNNYQTQRFFWVGIFAAIYSFWMLFGIGTAVGFYGCLIYIASFPFYVLCQWQKKK